MSNLVQKRCPQCNAPIAVGNNDATVTCRYCGAVHTVSKARPPKPPRVQAFGSGNIPPMPTNVVYMGSAQAAGSLVWIVVVVIFVLISAIGGIIGKAGRFFVKLPLVCHTNESVTIKGKTFDGSGPAIEAATNCKITIENSTITSAEAVVSGPNAYNVEVRLVNTTLTSTKGHAIDLGTNGKVWLKDKSKLKGAEDGIHGTINLEVDAKDSSIEGAIGISGDSNTKVLLTNTTVSGKDHAIKSGSNAKITSKASTIKADDIAFEFQSNATLDLQETTVTSADDAIRFTSSSGDVKLTKKSSIIAKKGNGIRSSSSGLKLLIDDSRVESDATAIDGNGNADIRLKNGAVVRGNNVGIDSTYNLKLNLDGGRLESQKVAVRGTSNAEVRAVDGFVIKAPKAFEFSSKPSRLDVATSVVPVDQQDVTPAGGNSGGPAPSGSISSAMSAAVRPCVNGQKGKLTLRTVIDPSGNAAAVQALQSTLPASVTTCIVNRVKATRFPAQSSMTTTTQTFNLL
ncbi:MAG: hypothetical protein U0174_01900 [Polyangiaceae bacterium]